MGYSARYHATSLVAVFLALAIGILIGAEFGGDALTNTRKDLEHSLTGNLQDARARADDLSGELAAPTNSPAASTRRWSATGCAAGGSAWSRSATCPGDTSAAIEEALGPTGARLVGVGVVREPVDLRGARRRPREDPLRRHPDATRTRWPPSATGVGPAARPRRHPARPRPRASSSRGRAATSARSTA